MARRRLSIWTCRARSFRCALRARSPFACPFPPSMRPRRARARTRSGRRRGTRRTLPTSRSSCPTRSSRPTSSPAGTSLRKRVACAARVLRSARARGAQASAPPKSRIARAVAGRLKSLRKATMPPSRILRRRSKTSNPLAALPPSASRAAAQIRRRARPSRASSPRSARQNIKSRSAPKRRGEASRSRVLALARSPRVFARSLKSRHRLRGRVNRERAVSVLRRAALPRKTSIVARAGARTRPAAARKTKAKESKCPSTTRF